MELYYRTYGNGDPLIILHGLYGSSDNWMTAGKKLAETHQVFIPDLRNHGNSPHSISHNYDVMLDDLLEFFEQHGIKNATLIGHSMGGKLAAYFAYHHPLLVKKMVIVDINPLPQDQDTMNKKHVQEHLSIISALQSIDLSDIKSRTDADNILAGSIPSKTIRQFLLKNLSRDKQNQFVWKINLETLQKELPNIMGGIPVQNEMVQIGIPTYFLYGELSHYFDEADIPDIKKAFTNCRFEEFEQTGHWIHAEQPAKFLEITQSYIE